ncbi:RNA-protein complex protein Nop10 [Candidatus Woesearchaeota archaeon]|nr:RNA-protein complex protein Nop10 [Candidatus Woesearchaeota archaeon]
MKHILKCVDCKIYTMKEKCPSCGKATVLSKPAKFNPKDPYGDYRRKAKKDLLIKKGLL